MSYVKVKPPGQPVPIVSKREAESIVYSLDVTELLTATSEMVNGVESIQTELELIEVKPKQGKLIEFRICPNKISAAQYKDFKTNIMFKTSAGNIRSALITVRVYK